MYLNKYHIHEPENSRLLRCLFPKVIYRFDTISIKILADFFKRSYVLVQKAKDLE